MGARRTVIVVGALLVAAVAAFANYAYLQSVQDRANDGAKLVRVFIVAKNIDKGVLGQQAVDARLVRPGEIPRKFRPGSAITGTDSIKDKIALTALSAGQVVVNEMFVKPIEAHESFSRAIKAGHVAITISVSDIQGVAGLLVPGDLVNILAKDGPNERFLFQNVKVIAIGTTAAPRVGETQAATNPGSNLITFEVPPQAAAKIALATGIYLTLVPPDNQAQPVGPVGPGDLFSGPLVPSPTTP